MLADFQDVLAGRALNPEESSCDWQECIVPLKNRTNVLIPLIKKKVVAGNNGNAALRIEQRLRAIADAGTALGSAEILTAELLQQFLGLATSAHKGDLVCRMTKSLCDSRCKLGTEMTKFIDKCRSAYGSRIGKTGFWHLTFAELEKGAEEIWYNIQPVSLKKNATIQFLILAPSTSAVRKYPPLSYWTESHVSATQHLAVRPGAEIWTSFRAIFVDESSESYDDIHKLPCCGAPFSATTALPVKIFEQGNKAGRGVAMLVGTKVLHESDDDCAEGDFHFEEAEGLSVVCQANQGMNAPFSQDPAANNAKNIPLIASIMRKRLSADELSVVAQSRAKNAASHEVDELGGSTGEEAAAGIAASAGVNKENQAQTSPQVPTKARKRNSAQTNPSSTPKKRA